MSEMRKVITLISSERWQSLVARYIDRDAHIAALDLNDLTNETLRWPGSVAIIEVTADNLTVVCQYAASNSGSLNRAALVAVGDSSLEDCRLLLLDAGFSGVIGSACRAAFLPTLVAKHGERVKLEDPGLEQRLKRRLPWRSPSNRESSEFVPTRFSVEPRGQN